MNYLNICAPDIQIENKIAIISHDAHPHGAQFLALGLVKSLAKDFKMNVHTVLLGDGRLKKRIFKLLTCLRLNYLAPLFQLEQ